MAKDFVKINQLASDPKWANKLASFRHQLRQVIDLGTELKGVMEHNIQNGDHGDVESLFALPPASGQVVYNLVAGALAALRGTVQSADALTLIDRVG